MLSLISVALVIHLVNLIPLISAKNPEKCYLNQTFYTGIIEYCPQEISYCCYDLIGTYYCCEKKSINICPQKRIIYFWINSFMANNNYFIFLLFYSN
jgi:hypothetical protein